MVLVGFYTMQGFAVDPDTGMVFLEKGKYIHNLAAMPISAFLLLAGLGSVIYGVSATRFLGKNSGIWFGGIGTVLVGIALLSLAAYNNTAFYPSVVDLQNSLTIYNASSSHYTLTAMTYVALAVPFVLAYIAYVWRQMDSKKINLSEVAGEDRGSY